MSARAGIILAGLLLVALCAVEGWKLIELSTRVAAVESAVSSEQAAGAARREARLDLSAPADLLVQTPYGFPLTVTAGKIEENAEGCRVTLTVGNPFGVGYGNAALQVWYGESREDAVVVSLPERLLPGARIKVKVQVPVPADQLRWLTIRASVDRLLD